MNFLRSRFRGSCIWSRMAQHVHHLQFNPYLLRFLPVYITISTRLLATTILRRSLEHGLKVDMYETSRLAWASKNLVYFHCQCLIGEGD